MFYEKAHFILVNTYNLINIILFLYYYNNYSYTFFLLLEFNGEYVFNIISVTVSVVPTYLLNWFILLLKF